MKVSARSFDLSRRFLWSPVVVANTGENPLHDTMTHVATSDENKNLQNPLKRTHTLVSTTGFWARRVCDCLPQRQSCTARTCSRSCDRRFLEISRAVFCGTAPRTKLAGSGRSLGSGVACGWLGCAR